MSEFDYILEKISNSNIIETPFPHIEITNLLSDEHLNILLNDKQIHFDEVIDNDKLYETLINKSYTIQSFPGCVNSWDKYKQILKLKNTKNFNNNPVEGAGITFRLQKYETDLTKKLLAFMNSTKFKNALEIKFGVTNTQIISAIQKNLTGYEISPHPDIRQKALTYLLNINKNDIVETHDVHTHLLKFKENYQEIPQFWENNPTINRCWVPWEWCNTVKKVRKNNTLLIFKPCSSPPSMHAIKLDYDHCKFQRTQIYGNLMFKNPPHYKTFKWDELKNKLALK